MEAHERELYQAIIGDHYKNPRGKGCLKCPPGVSGEGVNPVCGDEVRVFVEVRGGVIEGIVFEGAGCAISQASASMMVSLLKGKSVEEAKVWIRRVGEIVRGEGAGVDLEVDGELAALAGVREYAQRQVCAELAWGVLRELL